MVSVRCIMLVKEMVEKLGLSVSAIRLGVVDISESPSQQQCSLLKTALLHSGLELMDNKKSILIERIKTLVIEMVHYSTDVPKTNFSDYLSRQLHYNYTYLANIFSGNEGITIEHFIIYQKIERTKELLCDKELSLTEIAFKLHYSSVGHLSNQFKKVTGLTPTIYRQGDKGRIPIEDL